MEKKEKRGAKKKALKDKVSPVTITVKNSIISHLGGQYEIKKLLRETIKQYEFN